ncbi:MAG: two-component regulator propeller domain-containing protein [Daejeonella sp.]|uniref:ligand-binding sensor domain-containing protein n=1 Tax=Daejeonella sp. TaxID=2805397 RepID=UPI002733BC5D|nr:two-component regulator propeller domain-containing protein [Daejeonella sp.]MDP3469751.1 two-component regulator propeller domain-containing protein [Daejeonella sp.]
MKTSIYLILIITLIYSSCRKDKTIIPDEDVNKPDFPEWVIYNKSNSNLTDNQINALSIDKNDVKWLGTANGLIRINAESWDSFNSANSLLPSNNIRAITVTDQGMVWVGTDKGIASYNGQKWSVFNSGNSVLASNSITCITYDQKNGRVWVGTDEGIVRIDKDGQWTLIYLTDLVISLTSDREGNLWAGMFNPFSFTGKIKQYKDGKWTSFILPDIGFPSAWPYSIASDLNNNLIAVLSGTAVKTLIRFDGKSWQEVQGPTDAYGLKSLLIEGSVLWVGGTSLSVFGSAQTKSISMPGVSSGILSMAKDKYGRKWLGTLNDGLVVYTPK